MKQAHVLWAGVLAVASACWGQEAAKIPERGLRSTGSFTISDIESIDNVSGSVSLTLPIASLPPGRAGFSQSVNLTYHSAIYDTEMRSIEVNSQPKTLQKLIPKPDDVWAFGFLYGFYLEQRFPPFPQGTDPCNTLVTKYSFRSRLFCRTGAAIPLVCCRRQDCRLKITVETDMFSTGRTAPPHAYRLLQQTLR